MDAKKEDIGLRNLCRHMLDVPLIKETAWAGSTFELPMMFILENLTDVDVLFYRNQFRVLPYNCDFPEATENHGRLSNKSHWVTTTEYWPRETVLRLNSKKSHIGFTQLVYDDEMNKDTIAIIHDLREIYNCEVCSTSTFLGQSERVWKTVEHFFRNFSNFSNLKGMTVDNVDGLHCPVWPEEAKEWKTRERKHYWPSQEIIDSIVANGCYLVAKSHDKHVENISEWRFSFSGAELTLIQSWNYEQKFIYHVLRLIKNDIIRKCENKKQSQLKTYHFKTLMLWACERNPVEFWMKENLESSLRELLCTLIEWMIEKNCPNYFIPSNNMWDNIPSDYDFDLEAKSIISSIEDIKFYIRETGHLQRENIEKKSELKVTIPNKLLTAMHLSCYTECHVYHTLNGRHRFLPSKAVEETEYFTSMMKYLYRALIIQKNLVSHNFEKQIEDEMIEEALRCFKRFRETTFDGYTQIEFSPFDSCQDIFRNILDSNINCNQSIYDFKSGSSSMETLVNLMLERINDDIDNPFYFLCCAYEANFHFAAFEKNCDEIKHDHWMKALKLCEEGLSERSLAKEKFANWMYHADKHLMVAMTKEFSNIFDVCINSAVVISSPLDVEIEASEFSVHFNSVDFLRYVRIQCMRKLKVNFNEDEEIRRIENAAGFNPTAMILVEALRLG